MENTAFTTFRRENGMVGFAIDVKIMLQFSNTMLQLINLKRNRYRAATYGQGKILNEGVIR